MVPGFLVQLFIFGELKTKRLQGSIRSVAFHTGKVCNRVWHAGHLHKSKIHGNFWSGPNSVSFPKDSIVGPTIFLIYIHDVPADFICNIAIYTDDSASKYD